MSVACDRVVAPVEDKNGIRRDEEFLRRWLHDPQAVKPGTRMINLQLAPDEIEELIAFLNAS